PVAIAVSIAIAVSVAMVPGITRNARSVRLGERADAVSDPVLAVLQRVLALLHALRNLLTPHGRVQASGGRRTRDGYRRRRHRDAAHQLHSQGRTRAPDEGSGSRRPALDGAARRDRFAVDRVQHPMQLELDLAVEITHV